MAESATDERADTAYQSTFKSEREQQHESTNVIWCHIRDNDEGDWSKSYGKRAVLSIQSKKKCAQLCGQRTYATKVMIATLASTPILESRL